MKIIIDIPECFYEYCKAQTDAIEIELAVAKGTPLPKSHGNLVDIDRLFDIIFNPRNGILEIYKDRPRVQLENELESAFDHISTIIKAESEEEI